MVAEEGRLEYQLVEDHYQASRGDQNVVPHRQQWSLDSSFTTRRKFFCESQACVANRVVPLCLLILWCLIVVQHRVAIKVSGIARASALYSMGKNQRPENLTDKIVDNLLSQRGLQGNEEDAGVVVDSNFGTRGQFVGIAVNGTARDSASNSLRSNQTLTNKTKTDLLKQTGLEGKKKEDEGEAVVRSGARNPSNALHIRASESRRPDQDPEAMRDDIKLMVECVKAIAGSIFSLRTPRDCIAGTSSAFKTLGRAISLSVIFLLASPIMMASLYGIGGCALGIIDGLLASGITIAAGAVIAACQIIRGFALTPKAIWQACHGQVWNRKERKWEPNNYSLPDEAARVLNSTIYASSSTGRLSSGTPSPSHGRGQVVDRALYDLLGVPLNATSAEIKRAFHKKSLTLHPDKNPGNEETTLRFVNVSRAYNILSDPDLRQKYDKHGVTVEDTTRSLSKVDPQVFFAMLFNTHHFASYVGNLTFFGLGADVNLGLGQNGHYDGIPEVLQSRQVLKQKRRITCALALVKRLQPAVFAFAASQVEQEKALASWEAEQVAEATRLKQMPCGRELLHVVGWIYANRAQRFFASGMLRSTGAVIEGRTFRTHTKAKLASVGFRILRSAITIVQESNFSIKTAFNGIKANATDSERFIREQMNLNDENLTKLVGNLGSAIAPLAYDICWENVVLDIENTVSKIVEKVLRDTSVSKAVRHQRAKALLRLGVIFQEPGFKQRKHLRCDAQAVRFLDIANFDYSGGARNESSIAKLNRAKKMLMGIAMGGLISGISVDGVDSFLDAILVAARPRQADPTEAR